MSCPRAPTRSRPEQSTCWATFDLDTKRVRLAELDAEINDPSLWDDPRHAATLTQDASRLRDEISSVAAIEKRTDDALDLASMLASEPDDEMGAKVSSELDSL